jgi:hypothetical protein
MKPYARALALLAALALPAMGFAADPAFQIQTPTPPAQSQAPNVQPPVMPQQQTPTAPKKKTPPPPYGPKTAVPGPVVAPRGSVVVPPGSIIIPPGSNQPAPGPSARRRASAVAHCNERQIECNNRCNHRTLGQTRTLCYNQCKAQFANCTARSNARP